MIEKIVNKLLDTQIKSGLLKNETIPIYRYGYTLLIEVTINVILSLLIGFALGEIGIVILFNLIFIPLRGFCGGWHAGKSWLGTMTSAIVLCFCWERPIISIWYKFVDDIDGNILFDHMVSGTYGQQSQKTV